MQAPDTLAVVKTSLVLTVIGSDKPGLVESLSRTVGRFDGNWEESRMARLAGKFAGILRVSVDDARADALADALRSLGPNGLTVVVDKGGDIEDPGEFRMLTLDLVGTDQIGIVREISAALAERGVGVDELDTSCEPAAHSGDGLFRCRARLRVPSTVALDDLTRSLEALAHDLMVDVRFDESN